MPQALEKMAVASVKQVLQAFNKKPSRLQALLLNHYYEFEDDSVEALGDPFLEITVSFWQRQVEYGNAEITTVLNELEDEAQRFVEHVEHWLDDSLDSGDLEVKLRFLESDWSPLLLIFVQIWGSRSQIPDARIAKLARRETPGPWQEYIGEALDLGREITKCNHFEANVVEKVVEKWLAKPAFELFNECYEIRTRLSQLPPTLFPHLEALGLQLGKVVHWLEIVGMPRSIWNSLFKFRKHCLESNFSIEVIGLKCPSPQTMLKIDLTETLQNWGGVPEFKDFVKNTILADLKSGFIRYTHCELQILQLMLFDTQLRGVKHNFIGCSKGSCEMCWQILNSHQLQVSGGTKGFRTSKPHHKVSANCDFPFRPSQMTFLVDALWNMQ